MPLYEGIGLISEKYAVVFDFGSAYTKCGFAGETGPRCIVPSQVDCSRSKKKRQLFQYKDEDDLYHMLIDFLHYLYFRHLLVNPKDRRVVVVESLLCPTIFRETLAKVLFTHYEVSSALFLPCSLVALCTLGVETALVVDMGYREAIVIPVYRGIPVLHAWQAQPLAGEAIHRNLDRLLVEGGQMRGEGDELVEYGSLSEETVEDIKVRTCFVTRGDRGSKIQTARETWEAQRSSSGEKSPKADAVAIGKEEEALLPTPSPFPVTYPLGGSQVMQIKGWVREAATEILFHRDADDISLSTMILDAVLKCPLDMRRELCENILLVGGTAMMPGMASRIQEELRLLVKEASDHPSSRHRASSALQTFKFHHPPAKENYVCWLGGAIFGATDAVTTRSLPREVYLQQKCVPDWANLRHNCPPATRGNLSEEKSL